MKKSKGEGANHPEEDQFFEGKIGSGFMSTIEGQPFLKDTVEMKKRQKGNKAGKFASGRRQGNR
ncbi:MAG: hypothetical protein GX779_07140 [Clostridia bacterium]|nr:hypothetical protein [Clostridia bacterium]